MSREELKSDEKDEKPADREAVETEIPEQEASPDEPAAAEPAESATDEITALRAEIAELNDKILRAAAENQNTRKRLVKQQQDAFTYRHQDILRDLVEVVDNFERAIESATESKDFDTFHQGIVMIEKQFSGMLTDRYNLERFGAAGEPFDPRTHEAMTVVESADVDCDTVAQVFHAGYRLHDRVLRPAKVVVSRPAAASDGGDASGESGNQLN